MVKYSKRFLVFSNILIVLCLISLIMGYQLHREISNNIIEYEQVVGPFSQASQGTFSMIWAMTQEANLYLMISIFLGISGTLLKTFVFIIKKKTR